MSQAPRTPKPSQRVPNLPTFQHSHKALESPRSRQEKRASPRTISSRAVPLNLRNQLATGRQRNNSVHSVHSSSPLQSVSTPTDREFIRYNESFEITPRSFTDDVEVTTRLQQTEFVAGEQVETFATISLSGIVDPESIPKIPLDLTLLLDTSTSMNEDNKLEYAKRTALALLKGLDEKDTLRIVTFASTSEVLCSTTHKGDEARRAAMKVKELTAHGSTNLLDGLEVAGQATMKEFDGDRNTYILILSDGRPQNEEGVVAKAGALKDLGIRVCAFGVGYDFNEDLLLEIAEAGGGAFRFIESAADIRSAIDDELLSISRLVARDLTIDINPKRGVDIDDVFGLYFQRQQGNLNRVKVYVGDVHSGHARDVVIRLSWTGLEPDDVPNPDRPDSGVVKVSDVAVSYKDIYHLEKAVLSTITANLVGKRSAPVRAAPAVDMVVHAVSKKKTAAALSKIAEAAMTAQDTFAARLLEDQVDLLRREQRLGVTGLHGLIKNLSELTSQMYELCELPKDGAKFKRQLQLIVKRLKMTKYDIDRE